MATSARPMLGHKIRPLIESWPGFDWERVMCLPEPMHDIKNMCGALLRLLVGKVSNTGYSSWSKDQVHREQCERLGVFQDVWTQNGSGPLPWRLSADNRKMLHQRLKTVSWPHYIDPLYYRDASFWIKPGHMWKARRKYRVLLFLLPTQLRDQVPIVRDALLLFVWAMRRLMGSYELVWESVIVRTVCITVTVCVDLLAGQVYSLERAGTLGILPGSIGIVKSLLPEIHVDLIFGLSLFEGCTPVDYLKPHQHHFTHYSDATRIFGPLSILWMNGFERFNKFLKGLVNNAHHAEMNMARFVTQTGAANFFSLLEQKGDLPGEMCHRCVSVSVNNLC